VPFSLLDADVAMVRHVSGDRGLAWQWLQETSPPAGHHVVRATRVRNAFMPGCRRAESGLYSHGDNPATTVAATP